VQTTDPKQPYTITQAPRIVRGMVIIGNAGAEYTCRGYVSAYDAVTGKMKWRFYTVPGAPGDPTNGPELTKALSTWNGDFWKYGGGATAWDTILYDPRTDLIYFGTGNGLSWSQQIRSPKGGDNLFVSSVVAVHANTGKYAWHFQEVPGDEWDYDVTNPLMTADLTQVPAQGAPPLPTGVAVRPFVPGQDEEAWRRVNSRAFAHHPEQGRLSRQDLEARLAESWFDPAGFLLAERDGVLLGSVWTKVHPTHRGGGPVGEIYVVGADPDAQGMGLGGALTRRGLEYMLGRGLTRAILYTDADNDVAVRAYTRAGFVRTGVDVQFG